MYKLAALKFPGATPDQPQEIVLPSGIPGGLRGGLAESGAGLIQTGFNLLFMIGIVLAVVFIMWSGIQWITSGGDSAKVHQAKRHLLYAVAGLVVILGAFLIVSVVIRVLGGDPNFFLKFGGNL